MIQRIKDFLRELRIDRLRILLARSHGDDSVMLFKALAEEINDRSPDQVRRMERTRGLC